MKTAPFLICGVALAWAAASAASAAPAAAQKWDGVWSPIENNMFDPSGGGETNPNFGRMHPPYRPEWEARYVKAIEAAAAGKPTDPTAACVPPGMPRMMSSPYAQELVVKDKQTLVIKEYQSQVRRLYTDGRKLPADPDPTYNGYSVGRWEGDTLVVETVGLRGDTVYDRTAAPHSDQLKVIERMRLRDDDIWEDQLTLIDPVAFTKPWVVTRTYRRQPSWDILEYACAENNRNPVDETGNNGFVANKSLGQPEG